jgi:hypothetical protein
VFFRRPPGKGRTRHAACSRKVDDWFVVRVRRPERVECRPVADEFRRQAAGQDDEAAAQFVGRERR